MLLKFENYCTLHRTHSFSWQILLEFRQVGLIYIRWDFWNHVLSLTQLNIIYY